MQTMQKFSSWFARQKLAGKLGIGCGGLFLLLCLCSIWGAILSPSTPATETIDVSDVQTAAVETAIAGINQTATTNTSKTVSTVTAFPSEEITIEATSTNILEPTITVTPLPPEGVIIQDMTNMRSSASLDAPIITALKLNTKVTALATNQDKTWMLVTTENNEKGWVFKTLIQFSTATENLATSTEILPTIVPTIDPIDKKWVEGALLAYSDYVIAMKSISILFGQASSNPSLLLSDSWKFDMAVNLVSIQNVAEDLKTLSAPSPKLSNANYWVQLSTSEMDLLVNNLTYGIDHIDANSIESSLTNMDNILLYFQNAVAEIEKAYPERFKE